MNFNFKTKIKTKRDHHLLIKVSNYVEAHPERNEPSYEDRYKHEVYLIQGNKKRLIVVPVILQGDIEYQIYDKFLTIAKKEYHTTLIINSGI